MRNIRVKHVNAAGIVFALQAAGYEAEYQHPGPALEYGAIRTNASGRGAHKVISELSTRACSECGGLGTATGVGGMSGYEGSCHYGPWFYT